MLHQMQKFIFIIILSIIQPFLTACSHLPAPEQRYAAIDALALTAGFEKTIITTDQFTLLAYTRIATKNKSDILRVYIEGDGYAFDSALKPSIDPTPINPLALRLAIVDNSENVMYIARPCQYLLLLDSDKCLPRYWTSARFSEAVIASINQAITQVKAANNITTIELFGYSGGGAVVALLALRRNDVSRFVTIAGNLDHVSWVQAHGYTPLNYSLNAADFAEPLSQIEQIHFVGEKDSNIDRRVVNAYLSGMSNTQKVSVIEMLGFDHNCCWVEHWPELLKMLPSPQLAH